MLTINNSMDGYLKNVEIKGNTIQNPTNLADIKSVGKKLENQELYEIPLLSVGKNMFDGMLTRAYVNENGTESNANDWILTSLIKINKNKTYSIKDFGNISNSFKVCVYDLKGKFLNIIWNSTFSVNEDCYVKINFKKIGEGNISDEEVSNVKLQLEEGVTTQYEPYKSNKITILSPCQLEKVGDIADRIIEKDGVWGVEKNKTRFDFSKLIESNLYQLDFTGTNTIRFCLKLTDIGINYDDLTAGQKTILTNFASYKAGIYGSDETGFYRDSSMSAGYMVLRIPKNGITTSKMLIDKLVSSGYFIDFVSNKPQFTPLPHDQQVLLKTFDNKTNISFLTEIEGTIKAQVPKSMKATVSTHTSQIENIYDELDRVKKLEESTVSTVTTDKDFANVQATSNGYFEDVKLSGKTLVNIANHKNIDVSTSEIYGNISGIISERKFTLCNIYSKKVAFEVRSLNGENFVRNIFVDVGKSLVGNVTGDERLFRVKGLASQGWDVNSQQDKEELKKVLVLDGEVNYGIPSYFEGLKSVGDGADELVVSSVNENLFYADNSTLNTWIKEDGGTGDSSVTNASGYIEIPSNSNLFIACDNNDTNSRGICFYDSAKKVVSGGLSKVMPISIKSPQNAKYIRIGYFNEATNIRLFVNNNDKSYTPHKADKKRILYYDTTDNTWKKPTLREWDTIEKHANGKYYYHQRSEEYVLNGSEGDMSIANLDQPAEFKTALFQFSKTHGGYDIICDKFKTFKNLWGLDEVGVSSNGLTNKYTNIHIRILKSELETPDLAGFKKWLQSNNVTVVYPLAQEKVFECTNIDLITYANETNYMFVGGVISPRTSLKVQNNISNVVSVLQKKVSVLESYMVGMFRAVLAGDMRAVAQTLYPNDFTHESVPMEEIKEAK